MLNVISPNISVIPIVSTAVESKGQYLCYSQLYYAYRTAICFPEATLGKTSLIFTKVKKPTQQLSNSKLRIKIFILEGVLN